MAKKDKAKKVFRLVILDEVSLKQFFALKLTRLNMFTYGGALIIAIGLLVGLLFLFTPLKYLLPPVQNFQLEKQVVKNSILIDSLKKEIVFRDNYFNQIRNIINAENIEKFETSDSSFTKLLSKKEQDSIINELLLREQDRMSDIMNEKNISVKKENFYVPLSGVISNDFNVAEGHYGVDIVAPENDPVVSVLPGTVIIATWSVNTGYIVQVQHANNIISVYKHNGEILKREGDKVKGGEPIALVGSTGELSTGPHLHFELWKNGVPVDPQKYINF
ncbi:MAG: M23 family metallopeptidase [Bacteroidota bacterium]|nr:M23 family metallopeptidase [Bacteroidota bacterium]